MPDGWTPQMYGIHRASMRDGGRPIIGYVYEVITGDPQDGLHPYVGKTETTVHQRVHGRGGHTSPQSIAKDPWKARILPGAAGWRILERVRDTGEGDAANDAQLRRAEAFWIDRLRPPRNVVRPVRPPRHESGTVPARRARPVRSAAETRRRNRAARRLTGLLVLAAACTFLAVQLIEAMRLPYPAASWVGGPALGLFTGWLAFLRVEHLLAVLTGRRAPRRRRRR
jgi:hypothetical protein